MRLGSGRAFGQVVTAFIVFDGTTVADVFNVAADEEALARAEALEPGRPIELDPTLAALAQARGYVTRAPSPQEQRSAAHAAVDIFAEPSFRDIEGPGVLGDFFEAAHVLHHYASNDTRQWGFAVDLRGTLGLQVVGERLGVLLSCGPEPMVVVMADDAFAAVLADLRDYRELDRLEVSFVPEPAPLARLLEASDQLPLVPMPIAYRFHTRLAIDSQQALKLAGIMGAVGRHLADGSPGQAWSPRMGGDLETRLAVRLRAERASR